MSEFKADLHCHSHCSDGQLTPQELIALAEERGLNGLSITDHDTVEVYKEFEWQKQKIEIIPGVEFSTIFCNYSIHVLAYSFIIDHPRIQELCERHLVRRVDRNRRILEKLAKRGIDIKEDELSQGSVKKGTVGRPHIALAMMAKGYVATMQEAFSRYLCEGALCFEPGEAISTEETLDCIHAAKGFAVIAHPHLIEKEHLVPKLCELPFDGIEVYYARFNKQQVQRWLKLAGKKKWLTTGGSDYHGPHKPINPLGSSWTPYESFVVLKNHYLSHHDAERTL